MNESVRTDFERYVRETITEDRPGWAWCFEAVVECYERASQKKADQQHFTWAAYELRRKLIRRFDELRGSPVFSQAHLDAMWETISASFEAVNLPDFRADAKSRLNDRYSKFTSDFDALLDSPIREWKTIKASLVRYGVYALWRLDNDLRPRSSLPTYIGKSTRAAGLLDRVNNHWSWWDHPWMGVTYIEVPDGDDAGSQTTALERAMIHTIFPPANYSDWKRVDKVARAD